MSDTILGSDFTIYYGDENRRKQIVWTGTTAKTDVEKMIDVYDAAEDLMTIATQMNDGLIFSAETPGEYTIGKIDAGEIDPWFIDLKTMEHVVGDYANSVSYTHLRAHETRHDLVCRLLLEKKNI